MSDRIKFDVNHNPEEPTLILARRNGIKIGQIIAENITAVDEFVNANTLSFKVQKEKNGIINHLWSDIKDLKLLWKKENDTWYQIQVNNSESDNIVKSVEGTQLTYAELSQIMIFDIEINTENDIARSDYVPIVLYDENNSDASLLDILLEKAPHYRIAHVDSRLASIQRQFTFNGKSLLDCLNEIAEEEGFLVYIPAHSDANGYPDRAIYIYDLESYCYDCGYRGDYTGVCPECGSSNIDEGYGNDTAIFVTADELANTIDFTTDLDSVKNNFKLKTGDDVMDAAVRSCNPNGSDYIWYVTDDMKEDMSSALVTRLQQYDNLYQYYKNTNVSTFNSTLVSNYNAIVTKYRTYDNSLVTMTTSITGYSNLILAYYNTVNLGLLLKSSLMPVVANSSTSASIEANKLTVANLSPVAVQNLTTISNATADSAILAMAKVLVNRKYQVKVNTSSLSGTTWTGSFKVTNYSDSDDTTISNSISITITDNYASYVEQKIQKSINQDIGDYSIITMFQMTLANFRNEIKKYSLERLKSFYDACQGCLDLLVEQGISNQESWDGQTPNLYDDLYTPYYNKLSALSSEIQTRENEIKTVLGSYDENGGLLTSGMQTVLVDTINNIQSTLDFASYLGTSLWEEFSAFRRDDLYENTNFISDGLTDAEILENAQEFYAMAENDIYKSAMLQHSISTTLNNLLVNDKFSLLVDSFELGNWLRIQVNDRIYKLRLVKYEINWDNLDELPVEFSDVKETIFGMSDIQSLMNSMQSMSSSYDSVRRQASKGEDGNTIIKNWINNGLELTTSKIVNSADNQNISWDNHGLLCRQYNPITDTYSDEQLKIINSGLYVTTDHWQTAKAGIGNFLIWNPITKQIESKYGVIADTLVGNLILGQEVGIYNTTGTISLNDNGVSIIADGVSGENTMQFTIGKTTDNNGTVENCLYIDTDGNLVGKFINLTITGTGGNVATNTDVSSAISDYDTTILNQEKVFNKLTDNGALQGLYMQNNQLYINATYINTGTLTSIAIRNGIAVNGVYPFSVDANGNLFANSATITGAITATSLTLGSGVTIPYSSVSSAPDLTVYIQKDGTLGTVSDSSTGFTVSTAGLLQASNAIIYGTVYASAGQIGGWTINNNYLQYGTWGTSGGLIIKPSGTSTAKSIGGSDSISGWVLSAGADFGVTTTGALYASSVNISGAITGTSGSIGGWTISNTSFYKTSDEPATDGTQYQVWLYAPSSPVYNNYAFRVRNREYENGSAGSWTTPFYIRYDGYVYASDLHIRGGSIDISTSVETDDKIYLRCQPDPQSYIDSGTVNAVPDNKTITLSNAMQAKGMTIYENWILNKNGTNNRGAYAKYQAHIYGMFVNGYDSTPVVSSYISYSTTYGYRGSFTIHKGRNTETLVEICEGTTYAGWLCIRDSNGAAAAYMDGDGGVCAAYSWTTLSDRRQKQNIEYLDIEQSANLIYSLKPSKFEYINTPDVTHHGLIAQDVEEVVDKNEWNLVIESVSDRGGIENDDSQNISYKTLAYTELIADLVATVQSLNQRLQTLESQ